MHSVRRLSALASQLGGAAPPSPVAAAAADAEPPFPALSGAELPPWHGTLPAGLRLRATKGVGTDTRRNRRMNGEEPDNMQPENGRDIWRIELVDDATAGGECVSWCCFVEQDIRIGGASVVAADVTGVGTWPHRRRNGYSSIVIEAALQWMKRQGMHITLLSGVPNYYHQFGYVSVQPEHVISVLASTVTERLPGIAAASTGFTVTDATLDDAAAICALYASDNATRTCTVDRPLEMVTAQLESAIGTGEEPPMREWRFVQTADGGQFGRLMSLSEDERTATVRFFGEPEDESIKVEEDDDGDKHYTLEVPAESIERASFWGSNWVVIRAEGSDEILGYFAWNEIFPLVASYLAERAAEGGRIQAELPSDHPFARYLHQVGAFEYTTHPWSAHTMVRVVDQQGLFAGPLLPEISRRLWASPSAEARAWRGVLAFTTELGTVCLEVSGSANAAPFVSMVDAPAAAATAECTLVVPQHRLTQLLFGTVALDIVALDGEDGGVQMPTDAAVVAAMDGMFPPGTPWRWGADFM